MERRKVKNGEKSPQGQCLTRPIPTVAAVLASDWRQKTCVFLTFTRPLYLPLGLRGRYKSRKETVKTVTKIIKILPGFLVLCRKLAVPFLQVFCSCIHVSFRIVFMQLRCRLLVWCIKLSGAGVIHRSHKFHYNLLSLLPLPLLYPLTVFAKNKYSSSFTSRHG